MRDNAFTLIELLIVIAIAAIIAGALIPLFNVSRQDAKVAKLLALVDTLRTACEQFHFDTGRYAFVSGLAPTSCPQLFQDLSCGTDSDGKTYQGWNGPYISQFLTRDDIPFGFHFNLVSGSANFDLDGDGGYERTCNNYLYLVVPSATDAKVINDAIDKDIPEPWETTGKVQYGTGIISIYLL